MTLTLVLLLATVRNTTILMCGREVEFRSHRRATCVTLWELGKILKWLYYFILHQQRIRIWLFHILANTWWCQFLLLKSFQCGIVIFHCCFNLHFLRLMMLHSFLGLIGLRCLLFWRFFCPFLPMRLPFIFQVHFFCTCSKYEIFDISKIWYLWSFLHRTFFHVFF